MCIGVDPSGVRFQDGSKRHVATEILLEISMALDCRAGDLN